MGFRGHGKGFGFHFVCEGQPSGGVEQGVTQVGLILKTTLWQLRVGPKWQQQLETNGAFVTVVGRDESGLD